MQASPKQLNWGCKSCSKFDSNQSPKYTIGASINYKLKQMKEEMQLRNDFENRELELIALSEVVVLENYNRREDIKILDLPESHQSEQRDS